ncbi:hypothetical protein [Oleiharenicola lentus]|uniref:hypothetical protein n=1 Tax=Oleiharenicola lentus TaxID=2508720 RepID=UPI003F66A05B
MRTKLIETRLELPLMLLEVIYEASVEMAKYAGKAYRIDRPTSKRGGTLRPGRHTPLWNELRREIRPLLKKRGAQVNLGRLLGLPRQRVQAFVTRGTQMPDAERTLQLLAWLHAVRAGLPPS